MDKLLPRLQIVFAVLFAVISLVGPLLFPQGGMVILVAALAGIALGACTFLIGWRLEIARSPVVYPFGEWSARVLRSLFNLKQPGELKTSSPRLPTKAHRALGIFSLATGILLVTILLIATFLVLGA